MTQSWTVEGKVCVVTGGNSGIGLHTAIGLARQGAQVAIVSRDRAKGEAAVQAICKAAGLDTVDLIQGDLSSLAQIRALADQILSRYPKLHVLVNNAGLWMSERKLTPDGFETTFAVNHLGPFLLTHLLVDQLISSAPARIVNVASDAHKRGKLNWDDLQAEKGFGRVRTYSDSKLCNILFTRELSRRLEGTGVTANALHPGVVNTNLGSNSFGIVHWVFDWLGPLFFITPEKGAQTSIYVATSPELTNVSGRYFSNSQEVTTSLAARNDEAARRLWKESERLCGIGGTTK